MLFVMQSTPPGISAIAIVELFGNDALKTAKKLCNKKEIKPATPVHTLLRFGNTYIDDAVVRFVMEEESFNKMDTVEFFLHGGKGCVANLIESLKKLGAKEISFIEYTDILFSHKTIDYIQKESMQLFFEKTSYEGTKVLMKAFNDDLSQFVSSIEKKVQDKNTHPDEITKVINDMRERRFGLNYFKPEKVIILGAPNAGKSSLFNYLLGWDRTIISEIAGTTIDFVQEITFIDGFPVAFIDTCGITSKSDYLESLGKEAALDKLKETDVVLYLIPADTQPTDAEINFIKSLSNKKIAVIISKSDIGQNWSHGFLEKNFIVMKTSVKNNVGVQNIKRHIAEICNFAENKKLKDSLLFFTERQCSIIEEISKIPRNDLNQIIERLEELKWGKKIES